MYVLMFGMSWPLLCGSFFRIQVALVLSSRKNHAGGKNNGFKTKHVRAWRMHTQTHTHTRAFRKVEERVAVGVFDSFMIW